MKLFKKALINKNQHLFCNYFKFINKKSLTNGFCYEFIALKVLRGVNREILSMMYNYLNTKLATIANPLLCQCTAINRRFLDYKISKKHKEVSSVQSS